MGTFTKGHISNMQMPSFSLKFLFLLVTGLGVGFAFLGAESLETALAALFCFFASVASSFLICIAIREFLWSIKEDQVLGFLKQRRWVYVGSLGGFLIVLGIVISNFVLESSVENASWFILFSWIVGPLIGLFFYLKYLSEIHRAKT